MVVGVPQVALIVPVVAGLVVDGDSVVAMEMTHRIYNKIQGMAMLDRPEGKLG